MEFNPDALHGAEAIIISSETSKFIQRRENHGTLAYTAHEHRVVRPQTINNLCCAPREERPQNLCQLARLNSLIMRYRRTLSALLIALIISESGRTFVIWLMVHSKIHKPYSPLVLRDCSDCACSFPVQKFWNGEWHCCSEAQRTKL